MSLAGRITSLLTSLTHNQVSAMSATDRQLLDDQCQRVRQMIERVRTEEYQEASRSSGLLAELRRGERAS